MAFKLITGKMGSGKSYWGAEIAQEAWRAEAIVHSNLAFRDEWLVENVAPDAFVRLSEDFASWRELLQPGREGFENVLIIDEGAIMFNARDFAKAKSEKDDVFAFMVHARKLGLDIYFISQSSKNVDAQLRRMADAEWQCLRTKNIPVVGLLLEPIFGHFRRYKCANDGIQVLETSWAKLNPDVYNSFETDAMHGKNLGLARNVRRSKTTEKKWSWPLVAFLAAIGLIAAAAVYGVNRLAGTASKLTAKMGSGPPVTAAGAPPSEVPSGVVDKAVSAVKVSEESDEPSTDLITTARGRDSDGMFVVWLRTWGEVRVGTRLPFGKVTGFIREGTHRKTPRTEIGIIFDHAKTLYARCPRPGDVPKTKTPWMPSLKSFSPLPSAPSY